MARETSWVLFAIFGAVAAFGIGNMVQSNSVSDVMETSFSVPHWVTGLILLFFAGLVLLGGIRSIGRVTAFFVPIMAIFYVVGALIIIFMNLNLVLPASERFSMMLLPAVLLAEVFLEQPFVLVWPAEFSPTKPV